MFCGETVTVGEAGNSKSRGKLETEASFYAVNVGWRREWCVDARGCSITTPRTTLARRNKETSSRRGRHRPDWVASNSGKGLLVIRKTFFS